MSVFSARASGHSVGMNVKREIKSFFYSHGYEATYKGVRRIDHLAAISQRIPREKANVIFDVGANRGQTLSCLYPYFPNATFYCFEPNPDCYDELREGSGALERVKIFKLALGAADEHKTLYANEASEGSSLLKVSSNIAPDKAPGWLRNKSEKEVVVMRLDRFCALQEIEAIDLLKIDSQGYEARILTGASEMLTRKSIRFVFCEVLFSEYYEEQDCFDDVYSVLKARGYKLVDLYQKFWGEDGSLTACDALFTC